MGRAAAGGALPLADLAEAPCFEPPTDIRDQPTLDPCGRNPVSPRFVQ